MVVNEFGLFFPKFFVSLARVSSLNYIGDHFSKKQLVY